MSFSDKVVLITGASSGIGAELAKHFASLGAKLSLTGRNEDNLRKVALDCTKRGKAIPLVILGDISKQEDVKNIMESTIRHYSKLDVLINNAGFSIYSNIDKPRLDIFDKIIKTNLRAVYHLTSLAVPYLIRTKGNVINVSSIAGKRAIPGELIYSMSKAGLDQFTQCIALELAPKGVRVNGVNPGVIITEFQKTAGLSEKEYEVFLDKIKDSYPGGRVGTVDEVAKAVAFLASDEASFTTGALLSIDGGKHVACPR